MPLQLPRRSRDDAPDAGVSPVASDSARGRRGRRALLTLPALVSFAVLLPAVPNDHAPAAPSPSVTAGERAYRALDALPAGDRARGEAGVRRSAIELASSLRAVPVAEGSSQACPADRLVVSWDEPDDAFGYGAFVSPLGPAPDAATTEVNGVVHCDGSDWAFMGFEAVYDDGRWDVVAVPYIDESGHAAAGHDGDHGSAAPSEVDAHDEQPTTNGMVAAATDGGLHDLRVAVLSAGAEASPLATTGPVDGYARYEPQRTCSPTAKPGTVSMQQMLMGGAPGSRNLGIVRACHIGGSSEHKEGRAFDWGVLVSRPAERAAAENFLARLLATDDAGNRHALARRMGVMYVIWNRQIWSAYRPNDGWRPYTGASPHTDHVHISLSWDGAMGRTSYWSGQSAEPVSFVSGPATTGGGPVAPAPAAPASTGTMPVVEDRGGDDGEEERTAEEKAAHAAAKAAAEEQRRQEKAAQHAAHEVAKAAERAAHEEAKAAEKAAHEQRKAAERAAHQQAKAAEQAAKARAQAAEQASRAAEKAAQERAKAAEKAAHEQRKAAERAAHQHAKAAEKGAGKGQGKGKG